MPWAVQIVKIQFVHLDTDQLFPLRCCEEIAVIVGILLHGHADFVKHHVHEDLGANAKRVMVREAVMHRVQEKAPRDLSMRLIGTCVSLELRVPIAFRSPMAKVDRLLAAEKLDDRVGRWKRVVVTLLAIPNRGLEDLIE